MSSSDACCVRKGQLEQMMETDEKKKHFIQAKTLKKILANRMKTKISRKTFLFYMKIRSKTHPLAR